MADWNSDNFSQGFNSFGGGNQQPTQGWGGGGVGGYAAMNAPGNSGFSRNNRGGNRGGNRGNWRGSSMGQRHGGFGNNMGGGFNNGMGGGMGGFGMGGGYGGGMGGGFGGGGMNRGGRGGGRGRGRGRGGFSGGFTGANFGGAAAHGGRGEFNQGAGNGKIHQRLILPAKLIGCLIGKGGDKIKHLRESTGAMVIVKGQTEPERLITIIGDSETVSNACQQVAQNIVDDFVVSKLSKT